MTVQNRQELTARLDRLQAELAAQDIDILVATTREHLYYLTGVSYVPLERPFFALIPQSGPMELVVPIMEEVHLRENKVADSIITYREFPAPEGETWQAVMSEKLRDAGNVAIDAETPAFIVEALSECTPKLSHAIERVRLVKSDWEIDRLRTSANYADIAMKRILEIAYHGISEIEIFGQSRGVLVEVIRETDFEPMETDITTAVWPNRLAMQPHGIPTLDDRLESGAHIALVLCRVNGYATEVERTFFVERPNEEQRKYFDTMMEARALAFSLTKPGARCHEIDAEVNAFLASHGLSDNLLHRTGHGFGLGAHEGPWIAEGSNDVLEPGMVISVEPGIYIDGVGAFRHSDTVLITNEGYEIMTHIPTDIDAMTITPYKPLKRFVGMFTRTMVGVR